MFEIKTEDEFWYNAVPVGVTVSVPSVVIVCDNVACSPDLVLNTPEFAEPVFAEYVNLYASLEYAETRVLSK